LLEWPSTVFFVWLKGLFISRISVWFFFFWGFPYLCSTPLLYFVLSPLIHVSLFIMSFVSLWCCWCFSGFIYLFLCLLMFFFWYLKISWVHLVHSS
jgi:hypothetical protein